MKKLLAGLSLIVGTASAQLVDDGTGYLTTDKGINAEQGVSVFFSNALSYWYVLPNGQMYWNNVENQAGWEMVMPGSSTNIPLEDRDMNLNLYAQGHTNAFKVHAPMEVTKDFKAPNVAYKSDYSNVVAQLQETQKAYSNLQRQVTSQQKQLRALKLKLFKR